MTDGTASTTPFGEYFKAKFMDGVGRKATWVGDVAEHYEAFLRATQVSKFVNAALALTVKVDNSLDRIYERMTSSVEFGTFRGYLLEEITMQAARVVLRGVTNSGMEVVKLPTGDGFVTGASLKFSRKRVPKNVEMSLRRDREDVVVGFRRDIVIKGDGESEARFSNQMIPVCAIACKVYIDATRLENVLAKARGMYTQYPSCSFLVLSEWDALGGEWHDDKGHGVLESLISPVSEMIFLRGDHVRRPKNDDLVAKSIENPIQEKKLNQLMESIQAALLRWKGAKNE